MITITAAMAKCILENGAERSVTPRQARDLYERDIQKLLMIPAKKLAQALEIPFKEKQLRDSLRSLSKALGGVENELVLSVPTENVVPCDFELDVSALKAIRDGRSKPAGSATERLAETRGQTRAAARR